MVISSGRTKTWPLRLTSRRDSRFLGETAQAQTQRYNTRLRTPSRTAWPGSLLTCRRNSNSPVDRLSTRTRGLRTEHRSPSLWHMATPGPTRALLLPSGGKSQATILICNVVLETVDRKAEAPVRSSTSAPHLSQLANNSKYPR